MHSLPLPAFVTGLSVADIRSTRLRNGLPSARPSYHHALRKRTSMVLRAPSGAMAESTERAMELPWTTSVGGKDVELLFMPFIMHQLEVMKTQLDGLEDCPFPEELSLQLSTKRPARIESWQWSSEKFRKIRLTYIDAGMPAQVFNSVWYPREQYDAPLLGIDFLSFGKKKVLCVLDFQPLVQDEAYLKKYCEPIAYIKAKYEGLRGQMSKRFYDESQFFSKQLAFAKFDNAQPVNEQLYPAFKEYLRDYLEMIDGLTPNNDPAEMARIRQLHRDYDVYSAERDPAVGLFGTYWGKKWANIFTHEFLFSDAETPDVEDDPEEEKDDQKLTAPPPGTTVQKSA